MNRVWKRAGFLVCTAASAICLGGCNHKEVSWEKRITEETVLIEGLEGEYTFLFLTDSHVVIQDEEALLPKALEAWNSRTVIGNGDLGGIWPDETSDHFLELTIADNSPVRLMLAGHVHFYDNSVISEERQLHQIVGSAAYEGSAVLIRVTGVKETQ